MVGDHALMGRSAFSGSRMGPIVWGRVEGDGGSCLERRTAASTLGKKDVLEPVVLLMAAVV